jgi:hypothetical protein
LSPQLQSNKYSPVETTAAKFAEKWPNELRRFRQARDVALTGTMPESVRRGIESRAKNGADSLLKDWLKAPSLCKQILELRYLDPLPRNYKALLRERALDRTRSDISGKIRAGYKRRRERLGKFFARQLAEACQMGATVRARGSDNILQTLTLSDINDGALEVVEGAFSTDRQKWFSVCISRPRAEDVSRDDAAALSDNRYNKGIIGEAEHIKPGQGSTDLWAPQLSGSSNRRPTARQKLASWLRTSGSEFRNASNKDIAAAFEKAERVKVGEETIRLARKELGLHRRTKKSAKMARKLANADMPMSQ